MRKWGLKSKSSSPKNSQLCCVMMTKHIFEVCYMFLKPCFYMVIIHSQIVERLVSDIIKLQWSLPKRTLREADNPSTTDKPRGTELTCHEYNNSSKSPRSGQFSTTDRSHVPNVSVIRRLHCISFNHWPSSSSLVKFNDSMVNPYI